MSSKIKFRITKKNSFNVTKECKCQTFLSNSSPKEKIQNDKNLFSSLFYNMTSNLENKIAKQDHCHLLKQNFKIALIESPFTPMKHTNNKKKKLQRCSSFSSIYSVNSPLSLSSFDDITSLTSNSKTKILKSTSIFHLKNKVVTPVSYVYSNNVQSPLFPKKTNYEKIVDVNNSKKTETINVFYNTSTEKNTNDTQKKKICKLDLKNNSIQNHTTKRKKKPYKELTLEEKVQLIRLAEQNSTLSQACIAERYEIAKSNVCRILQRKKEYLLAYESAGFSGSRKRKLRSNEQYATHSFVNSLKKELIDFDKKNQQNLNNITQTSYDYSKNDNFSTPG